MEMPMSKSQVALVLGVLIVLALFFKVLLGFGDNVKQANETPTVTA
jgi:hypothetical protein